MRESELSLYVFVFPLVGRARVVWHLLVSNVERVEEAKGMIIDLCL
jgi:hypothetical protein